VITWHHQVRQTLHTWVPQMWTVLQHNTQLSQWSPDITRWDRHCTPECHQCGLCYNTIHNCHSNHLTLSPSETDIAHLSATDADSTTTQYKMVINITEQNGWKHRHHQHEDSVVNSRSICPPEKLVLSTNECFVEKKLNVDDYNVVGLNYHQHYAGSLTMQCGRKVKKCHSTITSCLMYLHFYRQIMIRI